MDRYKPRPVFFNVFQIHLPVSGFISIIHRVTGVLLVLGLPLFLYLLQLSLVSNEGYMQVTGFLSSKTGKYTLFTWGVLLAQHFFSGLRHIFMDMDIGVKKTIARESAWATLIFTTGVSLFWGWFLW